MRPDGKLESTEKHCPAAGGEGGHMGRMKRIVKAAVALLLVSAMVMGNGSMTYAKTRSELDTDFVLRCGALKNVYDEHGFNISDIMNLNTYLTAIEKEYVQLRMAAYLWQVVGNHSAGDVRNILIAAGIPADRLDTIDNDAMNKIINKKLDEIYPKAPTAMYIASASTEPLVLAENAIYDQVVTNGNSVITVPEGTKVGTLWVLDSNTSELIIGGTVNNLNVNSDMRNLQIIGNGNDKSLVADNNVTGREFAAFMLKKMGYGSINIQPLTAAAVNDELCVAYPDWAAACMRAANPQPYKETIIDVPDINVDKIHTGVVTTPTPTPTPIEVQ